MNLKLQKKLENDRLFYLVADADKPDTFYEYYEYPNYKNTPNIENICYKIMAQELTKAFKDKNFSSSGYKSILFLMHGIILDGNVIDITSSNELSPLIDNIRFKDLYNVINSFRKKLSIQVLDYFKDKILSINISQFSEDTKALFEQFLASVKYTRDRDVIFKEILYLAIINEYNRAYVKVYAEEQRIIEAAKKLDDEDENANPPISLL